MRLKSFTKTGDALVDYTGDIAESTRLWHNKAMQAVVLKQNGRKQRADVALSKEIAMTLVQFVLSGKSLYPPERRLEIPLENGETKILNTATLEKWCIRRNVIPETGETLKDVLDKARQEYRQKRELDRRKMMSEEIEAHFHRTLRIRTNLPVRDMFGKTILREDGSLVRKENHNLLKIKTDLSLALAERLMPDVYGKVEKTENKHLVFSLSDLRKAKEERDRQQQK